jgi:phosphoglycerate dehydrogenase-like enzyme
MEPVKIVVWDAVGNIMWGVPEWDSRDERSKQQLLEEDPAGPAHAPSWRELFEGIPAMLVHVKSAEELDAHIADADFLLTHKVRVPAEILRKGRKLRLVQHLGYDDRGIPYDAIRELGVPCATTPLVNYFAVAEHCFALILNHVKQMPAQRESMRTRAYMNRAWGTHRGLQLACDQTLGLLGFGEIGRYMARMAHSFNMKVIFWDIVRFPALEKEFGVEYVEWDEIWKQSTILSVHLALNDKTTGIIGAREIGLMKPGALFMNTARGKLVDQAALTTALRERRITGALDVFDPEPIPVDDPLHALHEDLSYNVSLTPHSAWQSPWTHVRDSLGIWNNVLRVLRGEEALHLVR